MIAMSLDKALYRKAYAEYRQWNEIEYRERIRASAMLTPQERWRDYLDLWNFCQKMGFKPSEYQRRQKIESLELYYARLQKMEDWRKAHGKKS